MPPITIWLQTLQIWPAPDSPIRITRSGLPITSRMGLTAAKAVRSPPTMIESDALIAPISPPLTGASSIVRPSVAAFAARARALAGAMLLVSIMIVPGCIRLKTPSGPSRHQLHVR